MSASRILLAALLFSGVAVSASHAQTLRSKDQPAEYPPSSYSANQYIDSQGCVYIRAGFGGAVRWVPRVDRKRNVICGQQPSLARAAAPVPQAPAKTAPVIAAPAKTAPAVRTVSAAQAKAQAAARAKAQAQAQAKANARAKAQANARAQAQAQANARAQAQAKAAAQAKTRIVAPTRAQRVVRQPACPGVSAASAPYINPGARCGPQDVSPYDDSNAGAVRTRRSGDLKGPMLLIGPDAPTPKGYRKVNTDGRHNTNRPAAGSGVITNDRRLILTQPTGGATVRYSSKSAPKATVSAPAASPARYVQVGTYGAPGNVGKAVNRLRAMGLPVRTAATRQNGRQLQIVLAGPFTDAGQLNAALGAARRAGYSDAFLLK
ncbi:MAG: SPOR domain-containing protein [Celeribacter sp.]|jgi:hypothetical protein